MQTVNSDFKRSLIMMDSEKKELRKRKTKRILIWTVGITAIAALVTIITILGLLGGGSS
jgi:hypothetical protein